MLGQEGAGYDKTAGQELLSGLNPEQREAVLHDEGPLLILAGAGSGKTKVITQRIVYLLGVRQVSPYAILAITFTNKAAKEMQERVRLLVGDVAATMWIGTFHAMFARILRRHAELLGYTPAYTIADTADQLQMLRQLIREAGLDEKRVEPKLVQRRISAAKNALILPEAYAKQFSRDPLHATVAALYSRYQKRMAAGNCMDFDDILLNTVLLFKRDEGVRKQYQQRFRYIMVDEYQDTNRAQYAIVHTLAAGHRNLVVVGDDDQSIYAFRGADIRNILDFEKDYKPCKVIKLEQNYRSTDSILQAANAVIAHNRSRKRKKLWTGSGKGEAIGFVRAANQFEEARYVAEEIRRRMRADRSLTYQDFAVLYRANALSRNLEAALREAALPYRIYGGLRFYDRKEIKDLLAYLRLIVSDRDELAFIRAVQTPKRGVGQATLETLRRLSVEQGQPLLQIAAKAADYPELSRSASRLRDFAGLIFALRSELLANRLPFRDYVEKVQEESGLLDDLMEQKAQGQLDAGERIENLRELLSDVLEFSEAAEREAGLAVAPDEVAEGTTEASGQTSGAGTAASLSQLVEAFLTRSSLYSEQDSETGEADFIRLMTIHAAKGLEFRVVFLVSAENGIFPSNRSIQDEAEMEEERRLAYVAITRAKEKFYVTTARQRMLYGQTQMNPVSVFVREIPEELCEMIGGSPQETAYPASGMWTSGPSSVADASPYAASRLMNAGLLGASGSRGGGGSSALDPQGMAFVRGGALGGKGARKPKAPQTFFEAGEAAEAGVEGGTAAMSREAAPAYLKPEQLRVGMTLISKPFGEGKLLSFELLAGDAIVRVQFAAPKPKLLMLNQAKLRAAP